MAGKMSKLTRLERVLIEIIDGLYFNTISGPYSRGSAAIQDSTEFEKRDGPGHFVHFAPWRCWFEKGERLEPGMIVMCQTSGTHAFTISEIVEVYTNSRCLLRNINDGSLCDMGNESFVPIIGLTDKDLETDAQREFRQKVLKAFDKLDDFMHRFGGLEFSGDAAIIYVRERYGGMGLMNRTSIPYQVSMPWGKRTTIKSIRETIQAHGYGEREFQSRLDIEKIGSDYNVVSATAAVGQHTVGFHHWPFQSYLHYNVEGGIRMSLITSLDAIQTSDLSMALSQFGFCQLMVETKNREKFRIDITGIKSVKVRHIAGNYWVEFRAKEARLQALEDIEERINEK